MKKALFLLFLLLVAAGTFAQSSKTIIAEKRLADPVLYIDSIRSDKAAIQKYAQDQIASVTIFKAKEAIDLLGEEGKNGVIYIETKPFAKKRFRTYFKSKSPEYAKLISSVEGDSAVQYILNQQVLKSNFEGDLAAINDHLFREMKILSKETLIKDYQITDKEYGVLIKSDIPENLYNGYKKF